MGSPEIANPFSGINGQMANGRGCSPENPYGDGNVRNGHRTIPYIEITEQPASKALRFRYECEGRSAGSIPGVHSTPENKTYPKIRIVGFKGLAVVVVSCVTKDEPYQAHPHNLVGKEGCKNGICTVEINNEDMTATFQNLGIQCVKKKDIEEALTIREKIRVDPFRQGFNHKSAPSQIDLNAVRLCFQAFLQEPGQKKFNIVVQPVISEPIYDKKAMSDLVITKLSHASGPATGHQEMILLCEKVVKEDIEVVFLEEVNGEVIWESKGEFSTNNVHKQVAIVFKTPPYKDPNVSHKVKVYIHLKRPSDKACSDPVPFYYTPSDSGKVVSDLLDSFNLDYSLLAKILADETHSLTRELFAIRKQSRLCNREREDESAVPSSPEDEDNSDDVRDGPTVVEIQTRSKISDTLEFSSQEAVDNLSSASQDKLKELGVVFSENEEENNDRLAGMYFKEFVDDVNKLRRQREKESMVSVDEPEVNVNCCDNNFGLYTSLQMAMKNSVIKPDKKDRSSVLSQDHYEFMPSPPRPVAAKPIFHTALPPLPPKRVKKNLNRKLPATPEKETKLPLLQRLFTRKKKVKKNDGEKSEGCRSTSATSTPPSSCRLSLAGDDLTEAEHYALCTMSVAPRATNSEFDENSLWYCPVPIEAEPVKSLVAHSSNNMYECYH